MKVFKVLWPFLFLAAILLVLFYKVFFLGQVFYEGDNFHLNIPSYYFFVDQLSHGKIPLWNPYLFLGIPHFADFNLGSMSPTNILYLFFPVPRALTLITILDFFLLGIGTYLLLRSFSLLKVSSIFGAVTMMLSGVPFILLGNMVTMQVIAYVPFLFFLARKYCIENKMQWFMLLIFFQFLQFISGHPQHTYYTMLLISSYFLFFLRFKFWKKIVIILTYLIFPLLLNGIQLFPFLEYASFANRPVGSIDYAGSGGLSLPLLATFLFPTFYGSHLNGTWWGPQQILSGFIGIPALLFFYIGLRFSKIKEKWYYICGVIATFILAFGKSTPFFYIFYYLIPGWKLFRTPTKILVFLTFFMTLFVAFGIEYFLKHSDNFKKIGKIIFTISAVFSGISILLFIFTTKLGFWKNVLLFLQKHLHTHFLTSLLFYDTTKIQQIFQGILWNICLISIFFLLTAFIIIFVNKKHKATAFLLITLIGFFVLNPNVMLLTSLSFFDTGMTIPNLLKPAQYGKYRIFSIPVNMHQYRQHLPVKNFFYREGQANLFTYQYDNNMTEGLYQLEGLVVLVPRSFSTFIAAKDAKTNVTSIDFSHVTDQQLKLSSVKYIISSEPIFNFNKIPLKLASSERGRYIYINPSAYPRAYLLEDPYGGEIAWGKVTPTYLSFNVSTINPSHFIFADWYYPGWKALVNEKKVKINIFKGTFREIPVPKGNSKVEFIYDPLSLKIGEIVSLVSIGIFIMLLFFGLRKISKE